MDGEVEHQRFKTGTAVHGDGLSDTAERWSNMEFGIGVGARRHDVEWVPEGTGWSGRC